MIWTTTKALLVATAIFSGATFAVRAGQAWDQGSLSDYVAILLADRSSYAQQIDQLRLQLTDAQRKAAAVDDYWRAWTGVQRPE